MIDYKVRFGTRWRQDLDKGSCLFGWKKRRFVVCTAVVPEGSGFHPQGQTAVHTAGSEIMEKRRRFKMEKTCKFYHRPYPASAGGICFKKGSGRGSGDYDL